MTPWLTKHFCLGIALGLLFCGPSGVVAQATKPIGSASGTDDVVFAIAFSPDESTLAVARGASNPAQRFGRIELWEISTGKPLHVIKGFDGPVRSISFSGDGRTIVSASSEFQPHGSVASELKWWDVKSGELKNQLRISPNDGMNPWSTQSQDLSATYSPDGKALAVTEYSASPYFRISDSTLKLLDAETGEVKTRFKLKSSQPVRLAFSPDGQLIATCTRRLPNWRWNKDAVVLWNSQSGDEQFKLNDVNGEPKAVAFSPDSKLLAVAISKYKTRDLGDHRVEVSALSEVRLLDVRTNKVVSRFTNLYPINSLTFAPNGKVLIVGGLVKREKESAPGVEILDLETGTSTDLFTGGDDFTEAVDSLALAPSAGMLAFQSGPSVVKVFDTKNWRMEQRWDAESAGDTVVRPPSRFLLSTRRVMTVAFSRDGKTISGATDGGDIESWDSRTGELKQQLKNDEEPPSLTAIAADGTAHAEVTRSSVRIWKETTTDVRNTVNVSNPNSIRAIALSADGDVLAVHTGAELKLLNTETGTLITSLTDQRTVDRLELFQGGQLLAAADENGVIRLWNLPSASLDKAIQTGGAVSALRFSPDGRTLASASAQDFSISLWNLPAGTLQQKLHSHSAVVNALAFSPDSRILASGGEDRTVVIWDLTSGKSQRKLKGQDLTVTSIAFSPDGSLLASAGGNASVMLWEVEKGTLTRVFQ